jgi:probable rRNA maturation factor
VAIEVVNRQRLCKIARGRVERLAEAALDAVGRGESSVAVAFVRDRAMRDLNRRYRGKDRATDVLSFPADDGAPPSPPSGEYLGDIVISTDTALRQATEAGHPVEREVDELLIHGVLHLCGYDHETDAGEMNRLEVRLRRRLLSRGRGSGAGG